MTDLRGATSWRWLDSTYKLQTKTYGYDFRAMSVEDLARYIMWNHLAAYQELGEVGVEYQWKPWATDAPFVNRERLIDEIVDVGCFLANILVALEVNDEEYQAHYAAKQELNRRRAASGVYSARKGTLGEGSDAE